MILVKLIGIGDNDLVIVISENDSGWDNDNGNGSDNDNDSGNGSDWDNDNGNDWD